MESLEPIDQYDFALSVKYKTTFGRKKVVTKENSSALEKRKKLFFERTSFEIEFHLTIDQRNCPKTVSPFSCPLIFLLEFFAFVLFL